MDQMSNSNLQEIIYDLQDQLCILFLGPEMMHKSGISLFQDLRTELAEKFPQDVEYFYKKDGFFLFKDAESKVRISRQIKLKIRNVVPDDDILMKVAQIPFFLIVSMNPDAFLSDFFFKYGIKHRFQYFSFRNQVPIEIEQPSRATPLIYNLCGHINQDDSLLLDYEDLFLWIQSLLGNKSLPDRIRASLVKANTFIFLGFQFEKWYSQLILRLLSGEKGVAKYAIKTAITEVDVQTFLVRQFKIQFIGDQEQFIEQLHEMCKKEGMLRTLADPATQEKVAVIRYLQNGDIDLALETLKSSLPEDDFQKELIVLISRNNRLKEEKIKGTLDSRDAMVEANKIIDGILEMTKRLA